MDRIHWALRALFEPSARIQGDERRLRARLHSALLLVLLVGGTLALASEAATETEPSSASFALGAASILLLLALYGLSRTRHYDASAALTVLCVSTAVWRFWAVEAPTGGASGILHYLALPLILAAVLTRLWFTLAFTAATLASLALLPAFHDAMGVAAPAPDLVADLSVFVVLVAALALVAAQQLEHARRALARQRGLLEQANAKLQAVEDNRRRLLHQVAHDMGSPLTPLRLQVALLKTADGAAKANAIAIMDRNLLQLQRLVEDIKDLGRIEEGQLKVEVRPSDLAALVQAGCETFRARAEGLGIALRCEADRPVVALMDAQRVQQVVNNLVGNALKFTPSGGTVLVQAAAVDGWGEVRVTDTGRGLDADEAGRLFQPFSQVHGPEEARERGTGLGLFISKGFLERQGGSIRAASAGRGRGTTFTFRLPLAPPSAA